MRAREVSDIGHRPPAELRWPRHAPTHRQRLDGAAGTDHRRILVRVDLGYVAHVVRAVALDTAALELTLAHPGDEAIEVTHTGAGYGSPSRDRNENTDACQCVRFGAAAFAYRTPCSLNPGGT